MISRTLTTGSDCLGIDDRIGAEFAREGGATLGDFRDDNIGALPFGPSQDREPDGTGAHYDGGFAGTDAGTLDGVQADGERLDQGAVA